MVQLKKSSPLDRQESGDLVWWVIMEQHEDDNPLRDAIFKREAH